MDHYLPEQSSIILLNLLRRVDWTFGIAYGDDVENFKRAINKFITEDNRILKEPEGFYRFI
jgi:small-conductance mechanosensitive channel